MMREEEFEIEIWALTAHEGQKDKSINVNYWYGWYIYRKSILYQWLVFRTNIFTLYMHVPVIMVLYTYKYWFKMSKRWKFPPLIKGRASSANCSMGNLTCSRHATYLHTIYVKSLEIHILLLYKSLVERKIKNH